jgi:glycosyltransferase involved in cell wall biosynthesis
MTVRLYGRDVGNGSLAVVTRGFRDVLQSLGLLEGLVALDKMMGSSEEDESPPGALARDAIFTGNLNAVGIMQRGARHERHWVQVTPNSTFIPKELLGAILKLPNPRILSCSAWGTTMIGEALHEMGLRYVEDNQLWCTYHAFYAGTEVQVHTVHHGVSGFAPVLEEIEKTRSDYHEGEFRVVHFSTTEGERKGTLELVKAWPLVKPEQGAKLYLVLDYHARAALQQRLVFEDMALPESVALVPRADLDATGMSKFLCHMHLVACPSRGEGFGLLPLQARACGVPCVATMTTGHSAGHVRGGGMLGIDQLPELLPIDDGPAALAQAVRPEDIASAIRAAYIDWIWMSQRAVNEAPSVIEEWSWEQQLAPLMEQMTLTKR